MESLTKVDSNSLTQPIRDRKSPRVYISYSHDSEEHLDRVLALSNRLRDDGIDCNIDQDYPHPPEGWQGWMEHQINEADFVLMICTERYYQRFTVEENGLGSTGVSKDWELICKKMERTKAKSNPKPLGEWVIPILFNDCKFDFIPKSLKDNQYYWIDTEQGYEDLYRYLTNQPSRMVKPLGKLRRLPHKDQDEKFPTKDFKQIEDRSGYRVEEKAGFTEIPVKHPVGAEKERGELNPCKFTINPRYKLDPLGRWNKLADLLVDFHNPLGTRYVYLIPSGIAPKEYTDTGWWKTNPILLNEKREVTEKFASEKDGHEIKGYWFALRRDDKEYVTIYSEEYDQFLNLSRKREAIPSDDKGESKMANTKAGVKESVNTARSISREEFENLKREVRILVITAMKVERDAVNKVLDPIANGITPLYKEYRFGYLGQYLVAHRMCGQASLRAATAITETLSEFRVPGEPNSFYVLMPGICCGLRRSSKDETTIACTELKKYFTNKGKYKLPADIIGKLKKSLETDQEKILLPLYLTPEAEDEKSPQFIGDILVATSIKQHNYIATKANKVEDRGNTYEARSGRIDLVLEHAKNWQQTAPEANFETRHCQVHAGLIISGDELVNHYNRRKELLSIYNEAVGLEMEGHGLGASVRLYLDREDEGKAWFLFAKGIMDWGVGKADNWQERAASASASLLRYCLNDPNFFSGLIQPTDRVRIAKIF
ncbi:MAG: TIR domain-containing protein [Acidobacteriota bacterium]